MLDPYATALIRRPVTAAGRQLARWGLSANSVTLAGFALGVVAAFLIANKLYLAGADQPKHQCAHALAQR